MTWVGRTIHRSGLSPRPVSAPGFSIMGARTTQQVIERVEAIAAPIVASLGLELVEVMCSGQGARTVLRVFIDKPGGVQIVDCQRVHESLGYALDVEDPIPHSYTLEVSSPGLDRPFRTKRDYEKALQQKVRVKLRQPLEGQYRLTGRLSAVGEAGIEIAIVNGKTERTIQVPWGEIGEVRREIEIA